MDGMEIDTTRSSPQRRAARRGDTDIVIGGNDTIAGRGFRSWFLAASVRPPRNQIREPTTSATSAAPPPADAVRRRRCGAVTPWPDVTGVVGAAGTVAPTGSFSGAELAAAQTGNRGRNGRFHRRRQRALSLTTRAGHHGHHRP